jgi:cephalosporin-C deacetylase-like acetyl esterase
MKDLTKKQLQKVKDLNERPKEFTDHYEINRKEWYKVRETPEVKSTLPYKLYWVTLFAIIALGCIVKYLVK